jgi:hypothetical protein
MDDMVSDINEVEMKYKFHPGSTLLPGADQFLSSPLRASSSLRSHPTDTQTKDIPEEGHDNER